MSLYTKKKDVDRSVKELFSKLRTDNERKLKGFNVARMYHHVGEHRTARQYLSWYLQVRPDAAPAHKLRGQILAADGEPAQALAAFQRSLELDPHQKDLVMTGCKLLLTLPADSVDTDLWLDKTVRYFPNDPIVFRLKQHRLGTALAGRAAADLEELMAAGIAAEPTDAERHVGLVTLLCDSGRTADAVTYVTEVEQRQPFTRSSLWYQCVADTCQKYMSGSVAPTLAQYTCHLAALDRLVTLGLEARAPHAQVVTNLYRLDQLLYRVTQNVSEGSEQEYLEWRAFVAHVTGQLYYHMASVILYGIPQSGGGGRGSGESREATDMALALLLTAQSFPPLEPVSKLYQLSSRQEVLDSWRRLAAARMLEVGWCILAAERHHTVNHVLVVQQQLCNQQGRGRIYTRAFGAGSVTALGRKSTSAFLTLAAFLETNPATPRPDQLAELAELAAAVHAGSLHRAVWLRMRTGAAPELAPQLQLSAANTATGAPESLCRLDVLAFLEATVFTTVQIRAAAGVRDPEEMFPPAVASQLCTQEQSEWWSAVHSLYAESVSPRDLGSVRRTLQCGIEVVRCLSGHGSCARLVLRLADWALEQATAVLPHESAAFEARAELYLREAVVLLDRLRSGSPGTPPKNRLFDTQQAELTPEEALPLLDSASRRLSVLLQRRGLLKEALSCVQGHHSAEASYQQGLILRQQAEEADRSGDSDPSDMLRLSLEAFYLTLDRLRDPVWTASPQLKDDLATQIREVETLMMEEAVSSAQVNGNSSVHTELEQSVSRRPAAATSTPRRAVPSLPTAAGRPAATSPLSLSASFGHESRPSLERVCAQVLSLSSSQETILRLLSDLRSELLGDMRGLLTEELRESRQMVQELKKEVTELQSQRRCQSAESSASAAAAVQPPAMVPPEVYGYMAAVANMRGVSMLPMGLPTPLPFPTAAYQGLALHDHLQDSLASHQNLAAQLAQPGLAAQLASHPNLAAQLAQPGLAAQLAQPGLAAQLAQPGLGAQLSQPGLGAQLSQPSLAAQLPTLAAQLAPQPASLGTQQQAPAAASTPVFSFKQPVTEAAAGTQVKAAPANVTVSSGEALPVPGGAAAPPPPSVVVPPEHRKPSVTSPQQSGAGGKSPHQFQIQLPSSTQINIASLLGDSDKPAFSCISTLPNIPAPVISAVTGTGRHNSSARSAGRDRLDSTGSFHEDPDYEPMADFKPIVALPEEVDVRTGEEGDTRLFASRCKLYRFTDAEWKERGVGELLVLYREDDGRVRLVMRRDQTHKVCANHFLQPDMQLNSMKNQPRAVIWAARDFADEELVDERLCARFKTEEITEEFKAAFEKGKQLVLTGSCKGTEPNTSPPALVSAASPVVSSAATSTPVLTSTPAPAATSGGFTFSWTKPASAGSGGGRLGQAIPTVVSSAANDDDDDEDDEYETEEETTTDDESDEEPLRIACKPEFNFGGSSGGGGAAFSFGFGGATKPAATSTVTITAVTTAATTAANAATTTGFKFGDKAPPTAAKFGFGFEKAPAAATCSVATPAPSKPSEPTSGFKFGQGPGTDARISLGGFSFTSTPTVVKKSEPAPVAAPAADTKPNPFTGFSFGETGGAAASPFAAAAASAADAPLFGSTTTTAAAVVTSFAAVAGPGFKSDDSFKGFASSGAPVFGSPAADSSATDAEEYEPVGHFEPVVPLPDIVETVTGEEAEEKLFGCRAKLYRMDTTSREWKERGVGEIKILRNTATGKCRVLMRREQVLKLCANHTILAEMKLGQLASSETTWVWSAKDFSEGEANQETLAVRFKTVELAQQFKEVFESCQQYAKSGNPPPGTTSIPTQPSKPAASFTPSQPSKPATSFTPSQPAKPATSFTPSQPAKPATSFTPSQPAKPATSFTPSQPAKPATSFTPSQPAKPATSFTPSQPAKPATSFTLSQPAKPATSSTSMLPARTAASSVAAEPAASATPGSPRAPPPLSSFVFGSAAAATTAAPASGQFRFSGVKPKSPTKPRSRDVSLNESAAGDDDEYYQDDEGEHLLFEPVVPLPDKVEVRTGEEEETVLYSHRSKLYRFEPGTGEWKERGLGDIKLLENEQTGKIRLVMRREQVLKICLNHRLTPAIEFRTKEEKCVVWASVDYADCEPRDEVFTARFKTPEIAAEFLQAVQSAQGRLGTSPCKPSASAVMSSSSAPATKPSTPAAKSSTAAAKPSTPAAKSSPAAKPSTPAAKSSPAAKPSTPAAKSSTVAAQLSSPAVQPSTAVPPSSTGTPATSIFGGGSAASSPSSGFSFGSRFGAAAQPGAGGGASASFTFRLPSRRDNDEQDTDSDEVQIVSEVQPTPEQREAAARLQLPAGFYLYEGRPPCPGCRGCRDQMPGESASGGSEPESVVRPSSSPPSGTTAAAPVQSSSVTAASASASSAAASSPFQFGSFAFGSEQAGQATPKATFGFGAGSAASSPFSFSVGSAPSASASAAIFGDTANKAGSVFGKPAGRGTSIFGATQEKVGSIFGGNGADKSVSVFGGADTQVTPGSLFGGASSQDTVSPLFGGSSATDKPGPLFGGTGAGDKSSPTMGAAGGFSTGQTSTPFGGVAANGLGVASTSLPGSAAARTTFGFGLQGSGPTVDFAALAKSAETFAKKDDPSFAFSGAGKALFARRPPAEAGSDDEAGGDDDSTHDPHFEPVVPLPELVEVRTGEESETRLFCHRAILYRFNKDTSEWKERGRGDFKLLHNPAAGTYRVLLRREQVHKLACNHRVTVDMTLKRLDASVNAWVWTAVDYADEEPKLEMLAVKFKTEALAGQYKEAFDSALEKLRSGEAAAAAESERAAADEEHGEEEEEAEDEEEDEDEDDDSPMFERHCTLSVKSGAGWKTLGTGYLRVLYDGDVYGVKVVMEDDQTDKLLCNNLITMQHVYTVDGSTVQWTARDYTEETAEWRTYCARLESEAAALDLGRAMDDGVEIAVGSDITEAPAAGVGESQPSGGWPVAACDPALAATLTELLTETRSSTAASPPHPPADED